VLRGYFLMSPICLIVMLKKNKDLHGAAPDECSVALLIIDMINDFNFEDGERLFKNALPVAKNILALKNKAKYEGIPVIYINDNFRKWKSDFKVLIEHCIREHTLGKEIVELIQPGEDDYFVLKPKHSAFFSTTLDLLLEYLNTETLIITGVTTDICVFFTANDAYMRDYHIIVPEDCVTAVELDFHTSALENIQRVLKAEVTPFKEINFRKYLHPVEKDV
jgi:nicotinamidase-related amidase